MRRYRADRSMPPVTYVASISHSIHSARGLSDNGKLARYLGPVFSTVPIPVWVPGRLAGQYRDVRFVSDIPQPFRPLVLSEAASRLSNGMWSRARAFETKRALRHAEALVLQSRFLDATNPVTAELLDMVAAARIPVIIERRELHPRAYGEVAAGASAREVLVDLQVHGEQPETLTRELELSSGYIFYSRIQARTFEHLCLPGSAVVPLGVGAYHGRSAVGRGWPRERPIIGFAGRNDYLKGYDRFAQLARQLGSQALYVSAGYQDDWARSVTPTNVRVLGVQTRTQMNEFFGEIDYLLLPSRVESFGLVAMEAIQRGVIPIVSSSSGVSEIISRDLSPRLVLDAHKLDGDELAQEVSVALTAREVEEPELRRFCDVNSWSGFGERYFDAVSALLGT